LGAARSCVAFKKELVRTIEIREVDLAEEKSAGIVVDETSCLRAVRGDGAALLLNRLVIDADPETASDWINLSRGWERMSPDDILEQSDFPDATLDLTCDPVGRLEIAAPTSLTQLAMTPIARSASSPSHGTNRSGRPRKSISSGLNPSSAPATLASSSRRDANRSGG
jgi:hypothetical protein